MTLTTISQAQAIILDAIIAELGINKDVAFCSPKQLAMIADKLGIKLNSKNSKEKMIDEILEAVDWQLECQEVVEVEVVFQEPKEIQPINTVRQVKAYLFEVRHECPVTINGSEMTIADARNYLFSLDESLYDVPMIEFDTCPLGIEVIIPMTFGEEIEFEAVDVVAKPVAVNEIEVIQQNHQLVVEQLDEKRQLLKTESDLTVKSELEKDCQSLYTQAVELNTLTNNLRSEKFHKEISEKQAERRKASKTGGEKKPKCDRVLRASQIWKMVQEKGIKETAVKYETSTTNINRESRSYGYYKSSEVVKSLVDSGRLSWAIVHGKLALTKKDTPLTEIEQLAKQLAK